MARFIFIFLIIVVYFLTIVSKSAICSNYDHVILEQNSETFAVKDTLLSIFMDDFEMGKLSGWEQPEDWEVSDIEKISGAYSLKHSSKAISGTSSIFQTCDTDWNSFDVEWSFTIKNGNWDPSSSNRFWFYLSADTIRPELINGWAVGVNITGSSDLLQLWRINKGKADSLIIQTDLDWNASTKATLFVKRSSRGIWTLSYQMQGEPMSKTFSGTDLAITDFRKIGLFFNYTITRTGQLWIDDISVTARPTDLFIQKITTVNSHTITLLFNKPINSESIHLENFKLTDESNLNVPIIKATPSKNSNRSIELLIEKTKGTQFNLTISGVSDLLGKKMNPETWSFSFSFSPEVGSVLINEVLFNPYSGGVDFVELVNVSEVSIPIYRLKLATRNDTMALKQIYDLGSSGRYLKPGEYLTCTKDPQAVIPFYFSNDPETFCIMKSFPSYSDDAGIIVLLNDSLEVIDEFSYSAKMHSPFLADENGVSLERISLDKPTTDRGNWASASSSAGFATPGLPNSQTESETETSDEIIIEPQAFSPNGDGYNDQLKIRFSLSKAGYMANVRIFDIAGRQVRFLVKNQSLAQEGSWVWDGMSDNGQRLKIGVYIILVEVFDQDGYNKVFKKTCTVTDRLE